MLFLSLREFECALIGMLQRSARLAAQQSGLNTGAANEGRDDDSEGLWCSCRQPQGDRFMIQCDKKGKNCYQWYHGNCVGVTPAEGRRMLTHS